MSFIRPSSRAVLQHWAETLCGLGILGIGVWWIIGGAGLLSWVGWAVAALGLLLTYTGIQHARFRGNRGGPGVVVVDEGRVTYMGPLTGGSIALPELRALLLDPGQHPGHWILQQPGQPDLHIPLNAEGSDALFDAFASLPGIRTEFMLAQMKQRGDTAIAIWVKNQRDQAINTSV